MKRIYKYHINFDRHQVLPLPQDAQFLHIDYQNNSLCLWFMIDSTKPTTLIKLEVIGTGWEIPDLPPLNNQPVIRKHLGTVLQGQFVWHIFEWIES